jgi:hypothetical protein
MMQFFLSEITVVEDVVYPDVQGMAQNFPSVGDAGGSGSQNSGPTSSKNPAVTAPNQAQVRPESPPSGGTVNNGSPPHKNSTPNNLNGTDIFPRSQVATLSARPNANGNIPATTTPTAVGGQTRAEGWRQSVPNTAVTTNGPLVGTSLLDRKAVETFHGLFFYWYLLALLLLLWLSFKLRREWQRRKRQQSKPASSA